MGHLSRPILFVIRFSEASRTNNNNNVLAELCSEANQLHSHNLSLSLIASLFEPPKLERLRLRNGSSCSHPPPPLTSLIWLTNRRIVYKPNSIVCVSSASDLSSSILVWKRLANTRMAARIELVKAVTQNRSLYLARK